MIVNPKMLENAHKIAYLIKQYPEKNLTEIMSLLAMPSIDINVSLWLATDLGFIEEPNKETGEVKFLRDPETWEFGEIVGKLRHMLVYSFEKLATKETDLEENYVSNWTQGYAPHDVLIAVKYLLETKKLAEYEIKDGEKGENVYIFYTLPENLDKKWGKAQFKKDPTAEETKDETKE